MTNDRDSSTSHAHRRAAARGRLIVIAMVAWSLLVGCQEPNPGYCAPGAACPIDAPSLDAARVDAASGCDLPPGCPEGLYCVDRVCVACQVNDDTQSPDCPAAAPICAADHTCRACAFATECDAPLICAGGQCVAETRGGTGS